MRRSPQSSVLKRYGCTPRRYTGPDPQAAEGGGGEAPRAPAPPTLPPAHRASNLALTEFSWQITPSRTARNAVEETPEQQDKPGGGESSPDPRWRRPAALGSGER
ncbi:hypothetical protein NDU88_001810 [Pleurodeles waltl]|uniref:Uncharacterized protein n=1 Tax=Pleurodeles waltl TaxID=8319 RepID=A0AAV7T0A8_PLEWA|nr:hypothetical protein NDU88_001810 [Pleurodeles waltl]